jgi:subfamily B ATP-binding cassette protein MsbA
MLALYVLCALVLAAVSSAPLVLAKALLDELRKGEPPPGEELWLRLRSLLQSVFGSQPESYLYGLCIGIIVLVLLKGLLEVVSGYLQGWISQRLQVDAMVRLMRRLLGLDIGFHDRRRMGDLVSRIIGDTEALRATAKLALEFLERPPMILFLGAGACYLNWKLFLLGAVGVPLVIFPLIHVTRRIYKHAMKARVKAADIAQDMLQDLSGMRTVQAYEAVAAEGENFGRLAARYFRSAMRRIRNRAIQRPMAEAILATGGVAMLLVGALQVSRGQADLNSFLVFLGAMGMLYHPLRGMLSTLGELAEFVPSAERTFEILDIQPKIVERPDARPCPRLARELAFENVSLDYGRGPVFRGLNLRVRVGERVGIVGRTGVGKSSLLALAPRFYDPTEGRLTIDGVDIRAVTLSSLRSQMALVTQEPFLFHTSIAENIRYGKPQAGMAEVEAAARAAAIHEEIAALPDGYNTVVGERGVTLSGGQRQRVAVARAVLRDAPILLLDEATSALDSASEQRVQEALDRLSAGRTTLVVAHRLSTVRQADRIVVFSDSGGIEAVGPHDELLLNSPTYRRLWERQSGQPVSVPAPVRGDARRRPEAPRRQADG